MKECNLCFESLPDNCFGLNKRTKDGFNNSCKECRNQLKRYQYQPLADHPLIRPLSLNNRLTLEKAFACANKQLITIPCNDDHSLELEFSNYPRAIFKTGTNINFILEFSTALESNIEIILEFLKNNRLKLTNMF